MLVIPAVDLSEGQCVRLTRGEMAAKTVYSDDPPAMARRWQDMGAEIIHVIDLDATIHGDRDNLDAVAAIADAVGVPVQLGGGLRSMESVEAAFAAGANRAIVGTAAIEAPELLRKLLQRFGDRIVVAVDARDGRVAVKGWTDVTDVAATDLARQMQDAGARRLLCTDIASDGTLSGPNIPGIRAMCEAVDIPILAAGGVSCVDDIIALTELVPVGLEGAVTGQAIYTGDLDLRDAIAAAREP
ncbi:MAG: 1-(5-phosphoribosyl)-5-[(5-phosphoribosylamino)methylideneamino]imidazole-4-carboxamide isomerase [Armatimonadota bacterium]|jgi:phosphoribosylformimino-5-aminoimidazole carboxamide ribotide isomerase